MCTDSKAPDRSIIRGLKVGGESIGSVLKRSYAILLDACKLCRVLNIAPTAHAVFCSPVWRN
jgi:hypothetical protein